MQFIYDNENLTLVKEAQVYHIPSEDIERLINRPSTRVLRYLDEGVMKSMPLAMTIGEIDGYALLSQK